MSGFAESLATARHVVAALMLIVGVIGLTASIAGQIRFPDFFTRLQAALIGAAPATLILLGLAVEAWDGRMTVRLILLGILIVALAPVRAHLLAGAAHAAGLAPVVGRQAGGERR